ncbi:MAG: hypothetical protein M3Q34_04585 [bacterium]|nr:hypothetical protein [bacterium]
MKDWLAIIAAIVNGLGYLLYVRQVKNKSSKPNITSWGLWAFISFVDFLSYKDLSKSFVLLRLCLFILLTKRSGKTEGMKTRTHGGYIHSGIF